MTAHTETFLNWSLESVCTKSKTTTLILIIKVPNCNGHPGIPGPGLELRLTNIPPPPPGFEDSGDEFYLDKPEDPAECADAFASDLNETMNVSDEDEQAGEVLMRTGSGTQPLCINSMSYSDSYQALPYACSFRSQTSSEDDPVVRGGSIAEVAHVYHQFSLRPQRLRRG